ncbi:MAG: hypothetical protein NXI31_07175 [bacterium]|nr:hypothetical protein [bacterium]
MSQTPTYMTQPGLPFAFQRVLCFALLLGMIAYAIAAALTLQVNGGRGLADHPRPVLEDIAIVVGCAVGVAGAIANVVLRRLAAGQERAQRAMTRFLATLIPLILLEGGCLLAVTVWLLNGKAVPALPTALVLLALAIAIVPFSDPDTAESRG